MPAYPRLSVVKNHYEKIKLILRNHGASSKLITSISTKALKTARRKTGTNKTNREYRWKIKTSHPDFGTEHHCYIVFVKLCAQIFCFDNAPIINDQKFKAILENKYLGHSIAPGTFQDSLLLEKLDFNDIVNKSKTPTHGYSDFHIGHEDPKLKPKHQPDNIQWRSHRSNSIQGNMTLREARIYFLKMIARYFDLGEINHV